MSVRVYDNGSYFSVSIGENEVYEFRRRWPASGLGGLNNLWAQFDKHNGDLVDMQCNRKQDCERFDGSALSALVADMQSYGEAKLGISTGRDSGGDWKQYLGVPKKTSSGHRHRRRS